MHIFTPKHCMTTTTYQCMPFDLWLQPRRKKSKFKFRHSQSRRASNNRCADANCGGTIALSCGHAIKFHKNSRNKERPATIWWITSSATGSALDVSLKERGLLGQSIILPSKLYMSFHTFKFRMKLYAQSDRRSPGRGFESAENILLSSQCLCHPQNTKAGLTTGGSLVSPLQGITATRLLSRLQINFAAGLKTCQCP